MNSQENPPESPASTGGTRAAARPRQAGFLACVSLLLLTACAYARIGFEEFQFINVDDESYVTDNPHVRTGLSWANAVWALTAYHAGNWHPLTWLSLQLDTQLFGLNPRAFHIVNVALHAVNAMLLFLVLRRLTGAFWPCSAVAAFFAVHPLHVESVAWIAERKDVLSGLFFLLTLWAYAVYAERPSRLRYLLVLLLFALGLMAKPMLVTLPCLLLLLDFWPLRRFSFSPPGALPGEVEVHHSSLITHHSSLIRRLIAEKLPLLALAAGACLLTFRAQVGFIQSTAAVQLADRLANAVVSYVEYLRATFWPADLAFFYPLNRKDLLWWRVAGSALLLAAITTLALVERRRRPHLLVGWLWYLGMLVPVIGLVQVAGQARADRYTYLPLVGVFIVLAWSAGEWTRRRQSSAVVGSCAVVLLAGCVLITWQQSGYWHDSVSLWERTLAVMPDNGGAHLGLAGGLAQEGKADEAERHYLRAVELLNSAAAHAALGKFLLREGRMEEALPYLARAVEQMPGVWMNRYNLGVVLLRLGRTAEAREQLAEVVRLAPDFGGGHFHLGLALAQLGALEQARDELTQAVLSSPSDAEARYQLGYVLLRQSKLNEAWEQFSLALENEPQHAPALVAEGIILDQLGKDEQAVDHFRKALAVDPRNAQAHYYVGARLDQQGNHAQAKKHFEAAAAADPRHASARRALGEALLREGKVNSACKYLAESVRLNPRWADAQASLALALMRTGKSLDAVAAFRLAAQLEPAVSRRHSELALALADAGKPLEAQAEYNEATRLDAGWAEDARRSAWEMLHRKDLRAGEGFLALCLARQACGGASQPTAELLDTLAAAYAEVGRYEEAAATARKALALAELGMHGELAREIQGRLARYQHRQPIKRE
jgi:tetratricopeptide (TPR) repeat protein